MADVAQLVRASDCGSEGRGFKSHHSPQIVHGKGFFGSLFLPRFTPFSDGFLYNGMMHSILLFLAKYLLFVLTLVAFAYWLTLPRPAKIRMVVFGAITGLVTLVLVKTGAALYYDPRPFVSHHVTPLYPHAPDNGFPSDHTFAAAVGALTVFSASRKLGLALLAGAVAIGAARVIGHIHSPIDIIGSLVFATTGYAVALWATPFVMPKLRRADEHLQADEPTR